MANTNKLEILINGEGFSIESDAPLTTGELIEGMILLSKELAKARDREAREDSFLECDASEVDLY